MTVADLLEMYVADIDTEFGETIAEEIATTNNQEALVSLLALIQVRLRELRTVA